KEIGSSLDSTSFEVGDYSYDSGFRAIQKLLKKDKVPDAVCCFNDDMAIGAMGAIREVGLEMPIHIAVTGFDGSFAAAYAYPPLTTVHRPVDKMAQMGIDALLQTIQGDDVIQHISLDPELVIRKSS
ncbi:MAG: substrate-binding domain-containing protein, partial [Firmicutes bacterium]|nr:substrate-binding domain-containing protein [Bacillota bacterium]